MQSREYRFEVTQAILHKEWDRLHPCQSYRDCKKLKLEDGEYIEYPAPVIEWNWRKFSHGICPEHKKSILEKLNKNKGDKL